MENISKLSCPTPTSHPLLTHDLFDNHDGYDDDGHEDVPFCDVVISIFFLNEHVKQMQELLFFICWVYFFLFSLSAFLDHGQHTDLLMPFRHHVPGQHWWCLAGE